jgi:hypothetical protein
MKSASGSPLFTKSWTSCAALHPGLGAESPGVGASPRISSHDFRLNEPQTLLSPHRRPVGKKEREPEPGALEPQCNPGESRQIRMESPFVGTRGLSSEFRGELLAQGTASSTPDSAGPGLTLPPLDVILHVTSCFNHAALGLHPGRRDAYRRVLATTIKARSEMPATQRRHARVGTTMRPARRTVGSSPR